MSHDHSHQAPPQFTRDFWDARYASAESIWSGNPNAQLVAQVADLVPGTALDVGSGEGADAIWLAARGWQVTAIDVSTVALDRAAQRAVLAGGQVADRITWRQVDLTSPDALRTAGQFDLVSAQFMYVPRAVLEALHRQLAAAVRPGGTLLIVGHHPRDMDSGRGAANVAELLYSGEQVAATLDPADWQSIVVASPARETRDPAAGGLQTMTIHDAVMCAVRRKEPGAGSPGAAPAG